MAEPGPTIDYVMCQLLATFKTKVTASQARKLFMQKKDSKSTWAEHFLYMVAVSDACGGADSLVWTIFSTTRRAR